MYSHGSFVNIAEFLWAHGLPNQVQGIMADLGTSMHQLKTPYRGFSFLDDGPLDMRMDQVPPSLETMNPALRNNIHLAGQ
jgi:16S rRNA (cytosine1402-N4)-methyltransferase